jgi:hypothetical protein
MSNKEELLTALQPVLEVVNDVDPNDPEARAKLSERLPLDGEVLTKVRGILRAGVDAGTLCDREAGGVKFSRVLKAMDDNEVSIDAVHMSTKGPEHTHPNGEIDLCFAVSGDAKFDDNPEGWTVYGSGSRHFPTVTGGVMDILYFLPGGKIEFH